MDLDSDMAGDTAAVSVSKEFTRGGIRAEYLRAMATSMGKPTTHTHLNDGSQFNARDIPSSHHNHRESINRLSNRTARKNHAKPPRNSLSSKLFPDQVKAKACQACQESPKVQFIPKKLCLPSDNLGRKMHTNDKYISKYEAGFIGDIFTK